MKGRDLLLLAPLAVLGVGLGLQAAFPQAVEAWMYAAFALAAGAPIALFLLAEWRRRHEERRRKGP